MDVMTTPTLGPGHTRADLDRMPDDGNRYELIEGEIVMSPSPTPNHQFVSGELFHLLRLACPDHLRVAFAPLDVELEPDLSVVEPDILVVSPEMADSRGIVGPPLLAVEILSPSTAAIDRGRKKRLYERTGVACYWIVDPRDPISLTAYELSDGRYQVVTAIAGDEEWAATAPYDVTVVPGELLR
jgi:Uma2 family endonuclease